MWKNKDGTPKETYSMNLIWTENNDMEHWWYECWVKWDGCINFFIARNIPFEKGLDSNSNKREENGACDDYFHICNIDAMINKLIELKKVAMEHFKDLEEWSITK